MNDPSPRKLRPASGAAVRIGAERSAGEESGGSALPFSAAQLADLFSNGRMKRLATGARRACYEVPGADLCLKCYRDESETTGTVAREIRRCRHDGELNTCCQEYRYYQNLKAVLPSYVFDAFPARMALLHLPEQGWCVVESLVRNADGSGCVRFSQAYRSSSKEMQRRLLKEFWLLVDSFAAYAVRFYDTQNIVVQKNADGFRLRVVDFEPASRTLFPIDKICSAIVRGKVLRRAKRYLRGHLKLSVRHKGLDPAMFRRWNAIVAAEGAKIGLSECRVFLANKLVNDVFYEGVFRGRPCVVKCSSRAPDSIVNEYEMSRRLFADDSLACAEPLACWASADGSCAFVVTAKLAGGTPDDPAGDILRIAAALRRTGIVHRDVSVANLLPDSDGHLKLIDFQFAVDRNAYRECAFMRRHPKYLYVNFGSCESLGIGCWNDVLGHGLLDCLRRYCPGDSKAAESLERMVAEMDFRVGVSPVDRIRVRLYGKLLAARCRLFRKPSDAWRRQKIVELLK